MPGIAANILLKLPEEPGTPRGLPDQHACTVSREKRREDMKRRSLEISFEVGDQTLL